MKIDKNKVIQSDKKRPIVYDAYYNKDNTPKPVVIFCHGYKGFKDWGAWHLVAKSLRQAFFLKFNFSIMGTRATNRFSDLEASENTYTKELDDVDRVLKELKKYRKKQVSQVHITVIVEVAD